MIFLDLFITFFKIGLFGFGGGYGMLSLIQHETVERAHWLSTAEFTDIVAISQMTPGPIGINSATYCGYTAIHNAGYGHLMAVLGSATATLALVLPSFILMILISRLFMKYMHTRPVRSVFAGLRPAVVGLLAAATLLLCNAENFSTPMENPWQFWISVALFAATAFGTGYLKINPIRMICYAAFAGLLLTSCTTGKVKYRIGVSQCSADIWRDKQNAELRMGAYFQDNVELKFAAAYDSDERQVQQIDSLVNEGIDLLIVAPNQVQTISPAIDRAYDKGIPVIVFERKTSSQKYTAFISADNYEMGRVMGEYIISRLHGQGTVLEIKGLEGSSPAIERHNGFMESLKKAPGIKVAASLQGDWTEPTAYETTKQWLNNNKEVRVNLVFGANDRTAMGARKAIAESPLPSFPAPLYCGIDGLPGENGGIQLVRDSLLDASYIYPTHGDQIIDLAIRILDGKPYEKETMLMSALVTRDNAKVLLMQSEELMRQAAQLDLLHEKADNYLHKLDAQRVVNWLAIGIILLLLVVFVLFYLYHLRKISMQRQRVANTLWNMEITPEARVTSPEDDTTVPVEESNQDTAAETPADAAEQPDEAPSGAVGGAFISRFREVVESRLDNSDLSVDDLAADMNLSRVQLYRKVKAVTGSSPVELLRTARLNRAYQLLLTTDKSVSEVAYAVGFTAPSYFTKCFKEEYGMVPGDVRK